jgi:hypothetical protein
VATLAEGIVCFGRFVFITDLYGELRPCGLAPSREAYSHQDTSSSIDSTRGDAPFALFLHGPDARQPEGRWQNAY